MLVTVLNTQSMKSKTTTKNRSYNAAKKWRFKLFPTVVVAWLLLLTAVCGFMVYGLYDVATTTHDNEQAIRNHYSEDSMLLAYHQPLVSVEKKQVVFPQLKVAMKYTSLVPVLRYSLDGDENGIDTVNLTTAGYARTALASGAFTSRVCQTYVSLSARKQQRPDGQDRPILATVALSDGRTMYVQQQADGRCGDNGWSKETLDLFVTLAKTAVAYEF
jgi:hypothetical protein